MDIAVAAILSTLWLTLVLFFRLNRIWLPYYIVGSVGIAFLFIYIGRNTGSRRRRGRDYFHLRR